MKSVADGANLSIGNTPSKEKEKEGEKKPEGILEQLGKKLDQDLDKGTNGMIAAKKEDKEGEKGQSKGSGFDDLKKIGGAALEAGKDLLPEAGKGFFERLGNSSLVLGAERAAGSIPKAISGLAREGGEIGKTAFSLASEPLREVGMQMHASPPPVPRLELPRFESKGQDVMAAWGELAKMGISAERSKGRGQELGLGHEQAQAPARLMT